MKKGNPSYSNSRSQSQHPPIYVLPYFPPPYQRQSNQARQQELQNREANPQQFSKLQQPMLSNQKLSSQSGQSNQQQANQAGQQDLENGEAIQQQSLKSQQPVLSDQKNSSQLGQSNQQQSNQAIQQELENGKASQQQTLKYQQPVLLDQKKSSQSEQSNQQQSNQAGQQELQNEEVNQQQSLNKSQGQQSFHGSPNYQSNPQYPGQSNQQQYQYAGQSYQQYSTQQGQQPYYSPNYQTNPQNPGQSNQQQYQQPGQSYELYFAQQGRQPYYGPPIYPQNYEHPPSAHRGPMVRPGPWRTDSPEEDPEPEGWKGFQDKKVRAVFVRKVYTILMFQLLFTLGIISLFVFEPNVNRFVRQHQFLYFVSFAVFIGVYMGLVCCVSLRRNYPLNIIVLCVFTLAMSYMLGTISSMHKTEAVFMAVGICAAVCLAVSIFSFYTKFDFTSCGGVLCILFLILIIVGLMAIFMRSKVMTIIYASLGAIVFTLSLAYNTQLMMGGKSVELSPEEHIFAAAQLYVDIVNIFLSILTLLGATE